MQRSFSRTVWRRGINIHSGYAYAKQYYDCKSTQSGTAVESRWKTHHFRIEGDRSEVGARSDDPVFGTFVYTIATDTFTEVGTRSPVSDFVRFPTFTDYNSSLAPSGLVFTSFLNFRPDGTFPTRPRRLMKV